KAFKLNSIDYLLKPFDERELAAALTKFENFFHSHTSENESKNFEQILSLKTKNRFLISKGENYHYIETKDIAHSYSEDRVIFQQTDTDMRYNINNTLDHLDQQFDRGLFVHPSRNCIENVKALENAAKFINSRLKLTFLTQSTHDA